jgi:hypothetical protein
MLPLLVGIYIEAEVKQVTYRLNCSGEFTRARIGHSEVFENMNNEGLSLLASKDKIVPVIAFGRASLARKRWKSFAIRWCDFLHGRFSAGAGVFSDTLDIRESIKFGSLATVFQTEVYAILACSDYCRSANMHNMTTCICSNSKAALFV